jgi:hypothetical protein
MPVVLLLLWKRAFIVWVLVVRTMTILTPLPSIPLHVHQPLVLAFRAAIQLLAPG